MNRVAVPPYTVQNAGQYKLIAARIKNIITDADVQIEEIKSEIYGESTGAPIENNTEEREAQAVTEPKNIALTRMGDFYEAFGDEALELAEKLKLTPTHKTVNGVKTAMVGFPVHTLEKYQSELGGEYNLVISDNAADTIADNTTETAQNQAVSDGKDVIDHTKGVDGLKLIDAEKSAIEAPENVKITVDMDNATRAELLNKKSVNVVSVNAEKTKALDNIDKESRYLSGNLGQDQLNTAPPTSNISISDLVSFVNPSEGDFLKYFPDSMLDSEQIEGKNKALAKEAEKVEKLSEDKKAAVGSQVPNDSNAIPQPTSETPLVSSSASDDIVSQDNDIVKNRSHKWCRK